jgi:hypothetical protein
MPNKSPIVNKPIQVTGKKRNPRSRVRIIRNDVLKR